MSRDVRRMIPLSKEQWHCAVTRYTTPEAEARALRERQDPLWVLPILENSRHEDTVLELGSGTGRLSGVLAREGRRVTLLDWNHESMIHAQTMFRIAGYPGQFLVADVSSAFPFKDGSFDCVWNSGLLEHFSIEQLEHILRESSRVSSSKVISLVPNAWSVPYRVGKWYQERRKLWRWGYERPMFSLRNSFQRVGLTNIVEYSVDSDHALDFLVMSGGRHLARLLRRWHLWRERATAKLRQGYLLVTIGVKRDGWRAD